MEAESVSSYWLTRFCLQRALGFIYLIGFLIALNQGRALIGENGLLPAPLFLKRISFWDSPSLFFFHFSDTAFTSVALIGVFLSLIAMTGLSDSFGLPLSIAVWVLLWVMYLSIVNVGQTFYGFGWETLLLESGFLAIFLGSSNTTPPVIVIWLFRWILFRLMFGAGLIKIRADECWRDLTCMFYYYETQPLPNPVSWYFHQLPKLFHKFSVFLTHFIELLVPWGFFFGGSVCAVAGLLTILFQVTLIISGNLSWLNYITIVLGIACFNDSWLSKIIPLTPYSTLPMGVLHKGVLTLLAVGILALSIRPTMNLFAKRQMMNASFEPLHLVNTYGAFGSVTRKRYEIIVEGTNEPLLTDETKWREYEFKGKPGNIFRRPPTVSPYHWKLDWQMWFAAMSPYWQHPWFLNLVAKLLKGDRPTLKLMAKNPFPEEAPKFIRAQLYEYHFTSSRGKEGQWWERRKTREYIPPLNLEDPQFQDVLRRQGWLE